MRTDITTNLDALLPAAYAARHAKRLASISNDWTPDEERSRLSDLIEENERSTSTSDWMWEVQPQLNELKLRHALIFAEDFVLTAINIPLESVIGWEIEGVTTSNVIMGTAVDGPGAVDWDRWHDLLDKADHGGLTLLEEAEYQRIKAIVDDLDAREAQVSARQIKPYLDKHEKVILSIRRLTSAINDASTKD